MKLQSAIFLDFCAYFPQRPQDIFYLQNVQKIYLILEFASKDSYLDDLDPKIQFSLFQSSIPFLPYPSFFSILIDRQFSVLQLFLRRTVTEKIERMFQSLPKVSHLDQQQPLSRFQTQNSICSQYIKLASQKLYLNQATLITQANDLLQKLAVREKVKDLSQWDVFSTRDSVVLQDDSSFNLSNISVDSKSRLISRKNALGSRTARDFDGNINEAIMEIEKQCSSKTGNLIKKLAEEYKRMKNRAQDNEKKERTAKANEKLIDQLREKQVILTKKIEDLDETIAKLKGENSNLKAQNKDLSETAYKKTNQIHSEKKIKLYEEIVNNKNVYNTPKKTSSVYLGNFQIVSKLVEEKEKIVSHRLHQIRTIETKIQENLFKEGQSCHNCCTMLRKLKHSIITYKGYFEKQASEFEVMVDNFKSKILSHEKEN